MSRITTLADLAASPRWVETSTGVFEFAPNRDFTLATDDQRGGYSLTNGSGDVYVQGSVADLVEWMELYHLR